MVLREVEIAREMVRKGEHFKAKLALKKKRYQTNLIERSEAKMLSLEELVSCSGMFLLKGPLD